MKLCQEPRCPEPPTYRGRCQRHAKRTQPQQNKGIYNSKRWAVLRRHRLHRTPLCVRCGEVATDVDHINPIAAGGQPFALSNTQSLCRQCHSRKTRSEMR